MLDHLGHRSEADAVERAVARCVRERQGTPDVGGSLTTSSSGDAVCERLEFEATSA
jgi:isocitrate/isopropylmalate dehydrogenase